MEKSLILLKPSKNNMVFYSAVRRTSLEDGDSILKTFWCHYRTIGHPGGTFGWGN